METEEVKKERIESGVKDDTEKEEIDTKVYMGKAKVEKIIKSACVYETQKKE